MNKDVLSGLGIGVGIGLLAGAVIALLYAPQSGQDTRLLISEKVGAVKDKIKDREGKFSGK
jgi:gas vesicle protein